MYKFWKKARVYYTLSISRGGGPRPPAPPLDSPLDSTRLYLRFAFYLIDINDLTKDIKNLYSIFFADDTSVFLKGDNLNSLSTVIHKELASNKLTLNTDKLHYVIFHRAQLKQTKIELNLSNISLKRVRFTKYNNSYLLSLMKNDLRHILYIQNIILKAIGIIIKI